MDQPEELIGNKEAAAYVGMAVTTWRSYGPRGYIPKPDRRQPRGGFYLPVWKRETLDEWKANRPGQGAPGRPRPYQRRSA